MKHILFIILLISVINLSFSQTLFSETFNEGDGSTTGTDETSGVNWYSDCPTLLSGDFWEESGGTFRNNDSNGPATWTTDVIDVSSCSGNIEICFDYNLNGTFEACGTGCNSVDWISLTYTLGATTYNPANSYLCDGTCAGLNVIWDGSSMGSGTYCTEIIPLLGNTDLELEIGSQTWAGTETIEIDNINVVCSVVLELDTVQQNPIIIQEEEVPKIVDYIRDMHGRFVHYPLPKGMYFIFYTDNTHIKTIVK